MDTPQEVAMHVRVVMGLVVVFGALGCGAGGSSQPQVSYVEVQGGLGGPVSEADWEWASASRHVRCGLNAISYEDLDAEVVEGGSVPGWSSVVGDRGDRCDDDYET